MSWCSARAVSVKTSGMVCWCEAATFPWKAALWRNLGREPPETSLGMHGTSWDDLFNCFTIPAMILGSCCVNHCEPNSHRLTSSSCTRRMVKIRSERRSSYTSRIPGAHRRWAKPGRLWRICLKDGVPFETLRAWCTITTCRVVPPGGLCLAKMSKKKRRNPSKARKERDETDGAKNSKRDDLCFFWEVDTANELLEIHSGSALRLFR